MSKRRILSLVGGGIVIVVVLLLRFVVLPKFQLQQKKHMQWEDARSELRAKFHTALKPLFERISGSPKAKKAVEDCLLDRVIVFLNHSGCDYYYVTTTTSRSEADKKQDACLKRVGYAAKVEEILASCIKQHFPRPWEFMRPLIERHVEKKLEGKVTDPVKRKRIASCIAKRTVMLLNGSSCVPVNRQEDLIHSQEYCFKKDPKLKSGSAKVVESCITEVMGKPRRAAGRPNASRAVRRKHRRHHRHHHHHLQHR